MSRPKPVSIKRSPLGCFTSTAVIAKSRLSANEPPRYPNAAVRCVTPVGNAKTAIDAGGEAGGSAAASSGCGAGSGAAVNVARKTVAASTTTTTSATRARFTSTHSSRRREVEHLREHLGRRVVALEAGALGHD